MDESADKKNKSYQKFKSEIEKSHAKENPETTILISLCRKIYYLVIHTAQAVNVN
jgi:hypothetical protein